MRLFRKSVCREAEKAFSWRRYTYTYMHARDTMRRLGGAYIDFDRYSGQANFIYESYVRARGGFPCTANMIMRAWTLTKTIYRRTYIYLLYNLILITINRKRMPTRCQRERRGAIANRIKSDKWPEYTKSRTSKN